MITISKYKGCRIVKISSNLFFTVHIPASMRQGTKFQALEQCKTYESARRLIDSL